MQLDNSARNLPDARSRLAIAMAPDALAFVPPRGAEKPGSNDLIEIDELPPSAASGENQ